MSMGNRVLSCESNIKQPQAAYLLCFSLQEIRREVSYSKCICDLFYAVLPWHNCARSERVHNQSAMCVFCISEQSREIHSKSLLQERKSSDESSISHLHKGRPPAVPPWLTCGRLTDLWIQHDIRIILIISQKSALVLSKIKQFK